MMLAFYQSRVRQSFHRLLTLALPLAYIFARLAMDVSMLMFSKWRVPVILAQPEEMFVIPLFLGLASIGRDSSEGHLPLVLTRPIRRSAYVLSHWAALGTVASFWSLLHLLGQWVLAQMSSQQPPRIFEFMDNALGRVSLCFGIAAALVCFAARLPAYGNVVLWGVLYWLADKVLPGLGKDEAIREFTFTVRQYLTGLLMPGLDIRRTFAATPVSWFRLFTYVSNLSLLLLLAIHIFNRREVSYASR